MMGSSYTTSPLSEGTYPYFCMVHPWMEGTVIVGSEHGSSDDDSSSVNNTHSNTVGTYQINKNKFFQGDENLLKLFGEVEVYWDGARLTFRIYPPDGEMVGFFVWPTESGIFETYYDLTSKPQTGTYRVVADYRGEILGTLHFQVFTHQEKLEMESAAKAAAEKIAAAKASAEKAARDAAAKASAEKAARDAAAKASAEKAARDAEERKRQLIESKILSFVDRNLSPEYYIERYYFETKYKVWFEQEYGDYKFWEAVGISQIEFNRIIQKLQAREFPEYAALATRALPDYNYDNILRFENRYLGNIIEIDGIVINHIETLITGQHSMWVQDSCHGNDCQYFTVIYDSERRFIADDPIIAVGKITKVEDQATFQNQDLSPQIEGYALFPGERQQISKTISTLRELQPEPEPIPNPNPEPKPKIESNSQCGEGTTYKNGKCVLDERGGGCLIATAAFGSEMAPQVQLLREIRDNTVLQTTSGTEFMTGFNQFYYSFSPAVADYERENPIFKEAVKVTLTPLLTSLTLLNYVDVDTEEEMLGYGISIILLNIGMYFVAPATIILAIKNKIK